MALTVETCVARHTGDRAEQQDRVALFAHPTRAGTMLAVLADGMGGHTGGAMAAEQVLLKAKQNFDAYMPQVEAPEHLLDTVIQEAHVVIKLTRFTSEQDPHSTAVVFLLQGSRAHWAHSGDSRIFHFRDGEVLSCSNDHSLVGELTRKGRLTEEMALNHPQRNVLLSCLGGDREPKVEQGTVAKVQAGDAFVLCSDGLWGYVPGTEMAASVARQTARQAAQELIGVARQRGQGMGDNISIAIIKLVEAPAR